MPTSSSRSSSAACSSRRVRTTPTKAISPPPVPPTSTTSTRSIGRSSAPAAAAHGGRASLAAASPRIGERHAARRPRAGTTTTVPGRVPTTISKVNGVVRYSRGDARRLLGHGHGLSRRWNSTDQIPSRAIDEGVIARFGHVDPTNGGETHRYSLSADAQRSARQRVDTRRTAYVVGYRAESVLELHLLPRRSRTTAISSSRRIAAASSAAGSRTPAWAPGAAGRPRTRSARRCATTTSAPSVSIAPPRASALDDASAKTGRSDSRSACSLRPRFEWSPWLRTHVGLRADVYRFDVEATTRELRRGGERPCSARRPASCSVRGAHRDLCQRGHRLPQQRRARRDDRCGSRPPASRPTA